MTKCTGLFQKVQDIVLQFAMGKLLFLLGEIKFDLRQG